MTITNPKITVSGGKAAYTNPLQEAKDILDQIRRPFAPDQLRKYNDFEQQAKEHEFWTDAKDGDYEGSQFGGIQLLYYTLKPDMSKEKKDIPYRHFLGTQQTTPTTTDGGDKKGLNVLSLFDGMACGRIALERAGIPVSNYYASEIDKAAIKVAKHNWPDIQHIGDVTKVRIPKGQKIDLLIGGSPCQGFSFAGKQLNFDDPRSKLFFEFVRLLKECRRYNPDVKFLLENVPMKKEYQDIISNYLQCEPVAINSSLVSAQNRNRLYWSNFFCNGFEPLNKSIDITNILQSGDVDSYFCTARRDINGIRRLADVSAKSSALTARYYKGVKSDGAPFILFGTHLKGEPFDYNSSDYRMLTPVECERLQTVPDQYTSIVSNTQRYNMLGNGWTVDVIAHILKHINYQQEP